MSNELDEAGIRALATKLQEKRMRVHDLSGVNWEVDDDCVRAAALIESLLSRSSTAHAAGYAEAIEAAAQLADEWSRWSDADDDAAGYIKLAAQIRALSPPSSPSAQPAGANDIQALEETLGALEGKHGEGWINITMAERRLFARLLRERIAAIEPAAPQVEAVPPPGWRLVPEEPTSEMEQAAMKASRAVREDADQFIPLPRGAELWASALVYRAMLAASPPSPVAGVEVTEAARDVLAERARQVSAEGWTAEHDDRHDNFQLSAAAATYITHEYRNWPWEQEWWKPVDARRDLVKAGALILAEIERLDRVALSSTQQREGER